MDAADDSFRPDSVDELFARFNDQAAPKAKRNLKHIHDACNTIALARGEMNYSRVSKVAMDLSGGPAYQTILNSRLFRDYIDERVRLEQRLSGAHRATFRTSGAATGKAQPEYPCEGLDAKTRACIDMLRAEADRNERLIKGLQEVLERQTLRMPLSFEEALKIGPGQDAEVQLGQLPKQDYMPKAMRGALEAVLTDAVALLKVEARGASRRLVATRNGTEEVLLTPAGWSEALAWLLREEARSK
ncbi:hypothetical protein WG899_04390 [Paucibacter sp. AS339]|uniref:hypothetical protein n=1 Tax=Paucibacter hankyongi TaxID=3133434 RepID=UPI0030AF8745